MKQHASVVYNGDFFEVHSIYFVWLIHDATMKGHLAPDVDNETLGLKLTDALATSAEMERLAPNPPNDFRDGGALIWHENVKRLHHYKNDNAIYKRMRNCSVRVDDGLLTIEPLHHKHINFWTLTGVVFKPEKVIIPFPNEGSVIGEAAREGLSRCTGTGADLIWPETWTLGNA